MKEVVARVWDLAEPVALREGLEIVDVEYQREGRGMVLRLYVDRLGGSGPGSGRAGVTLDELAALSRELGDLLDVRDAVPGSYTLECSSPGINRRLRRPEQFGRYLGRRVRVRLLAPVGGRRTVTGTLRAVEPDGVTVESDGTAVTVRFDDMAQANYEAGPEEFAVQEDRR